MARTTPVVQGEILTWYVDAHERQIRVGTPAWYAWLEEVSTFAFLGSMGTFTARKEPKSLGRAYWRAYRKRNGKLHRAYLGKSEDITLERLNAVAVVLVGTPAGAETFDAQEGARSPDPGSPPICRSHSLHSLAASRSGRRCAPCSCVQRCAC
jgi:LuxR family maltose regulon positive regulatory protein